ncbi:MAG TPA: hypothetical protein VF520_08345 [Thermoleophilaceae bacterium]|jgi:hypothetical protein
MASCSLSVDGLDGQRERYRRLGAQAASVERDGRTLAVDLAPGFDRPLLDELVAVERECCPFLAIEVDAARGRLTIAVGSDEEGPMLDLIAEALGAAAG